MDNIQKISDLPKNKKVIIVVTTVELVVNVLFFYTVVVRHSIYESIYSILLFVPLMIAIPFSERSCIAGLFKHKWMKHFGPASLSIYLNHFIPACVVAALLAGKPYWLGCVALFILTSINVLGNSIAVKILRNIGKKMTIFENGGLKNDKTDSIDYRR